MAEIALECRPPALPRLALALLSDERLGALAAGGDQRAFATLYDRYEGPLRAYCRRLLRGDDEADDVVQTTMARALAGLSGRRPDGSWRAWLFRIAHNESMELLRRRRQTAELDAAERLGVAPADRRLEDRERLSTLVEDLKDLPERQRSALVMREMSGLEHAEIGDALAMSPAAARQAIFEARSALHDFEAGRDMACEPVRVALAGGDGRRLRDRRLRAHLRSCAACQGLRESTRRRRRAALLPSLPFLSGILQRLATSGGTEEAAAVKALAVAATLGATATVGLTTVVPHQGHRHDAARGAARAIASRPASNPAPALASRLPHLTAQRAVLTQTPPRPARHAASARPSWTLRPPPARVVSATPTTATPPLAVVAPPTPTTTPAAVAAPTPTPPARGAEPTPSAATAPPPPGHDRTAPGQAATPPGQSSTPPGQANASAGQSAPGQSGAAPGQARTPPGQAATPPGQAATPPGQSGHDKLDKPNHGNAAAKAGAKSPGSPADDKPQNQKPDRP